MEFCLLMDFEDWECCKLDKLKKVDFYVILQEKINHEMDC